jgi:hypothetical protein
VSEPVIESSVMRKEPAAGRRRRKQRRIAARFEYRGVDELTAAGRGLRTSAAYATDARSNGKPVPSIDIRRAADEEA